MSVCGWSHDSIAMKDGIVCVYFCERRKRARDLQVNLARGLFGFVIIVNVWSFLEVFSYNPLRETCSLTC